MGNKPSDGNVTEAWSAARGGGPFWSLPLAEVEAALACGGAASAADGKTRFQGLTSAEAEARLRIHGRNVLAASPRLAFLTKLLKRFANPLVVILLAAAVLSAVTGDVASFFIISAMVLIGIALDTVQEHRAERAAERLKHSVAVRETVLRDGLAVSLLAQEIVVGDIVLLSAGDLVPADGRVVEAADFFLNEAQLTGEPYPVEKRPVDAVSGEVAAAVNSAFMGSSVVSGSARLLVCATGASTQLGGIAGFLGRPAPPAALERGTYEFGLLIVRVTVLLALFALMVNLAFSRPLLESFLFAVALAVGLTPELLPMVVSVTLARGAVRLAAKRVIVKRLAAVHDLGAMDVLCTDKTGTLTEAHIELIRHLSLSGRDSERVFHLGWLNSRFESGLKSPLDDAILEHGKFSEEGWSKLDEVPFDFERRRLSVLLQGQSERLLIVKGAPEDVLLLCREFEGDDGDRRPFDADAAQRAQALFEDLGAQGFRVLAVAWRGVGADHLHAELNDESALVFAGFAAFLDPPKPSAGGAIAALARSGVTVKIVTGDNELVTRHVCAQLGIDAGEVLLGGELALLDDDALSARVENTTLFCRVTPAQKNRVLLALKRRGHTVGFLGDGINDAPSLHTADVGISVSSAVDVAKDAADLILLDADLAVLADGVREGRRTFGNIMKYVMMGTSSNFGNMFSMAGAALFLPFLPMTPVQILLNNLLYDISEVAIPLDEVDEEDLATPHRWDMAFVRRFMLVLGPVSSMFDFLTFAVLIKVFHAPESLFQTGWFLESLATQVLVIFVIRTRRNPLRSRPHRLLVASSLAVVGVALVLPFSPFAGWLGMVAPPPLFLSALAVMTGAYLVLAEAVKRWFYRHL